MRETYQTLLRSTGPCDRRPGRARGTARQRPPCKIRRSARTRHWSRWPHQQRPTRPGPSPQSRRRDASCWPFEWHGPVDKSQTGEWQFTHQFLPLCVTNPRKRRRSHSYLVKRVDRAESENDASDHQEDILQRRVLVKSSGSASHVSIRQTAMDWQKCAN